MRAFTFGCRKDRRSSLSAEDLDPARHELLPTDPSAQGSFNHLGLTDEINNPNLPLTVGTNQGVCFVELSLEVQSDRVGVGPEPTPSYDK